MSSPPPGSWRQARRGALRGRCRCGHRTGVRRRRGPCPQDALLASRPGASHLRRGDRALRRGAAGRDAVLAGRCEPTRRRATPLDHGGADTRRGELRESLHRPADRRSARDEGQEFGHPADRRSLAIVGALVLVAALVFLLIHVFDDGSSDADGAVDHPCHGAAGRPGQTPEHPAAGLCCRIVYSGGTVGGRAGEGQLHRERRRGRPAEGRLHVGRGHVRAAGHVRRHRGVRSPGQLPGQHSVARAVATQRDATGRRGHGVLRFPRRRAHRGLDRRRRPAGQLSRRAHDRPEPRPAVHVVERPPVAASPPRP